MAALKVLEFPDPRLRTKAAAVEAVDDAIRRLIADMLETMYAAPGLGLAATQVDVHKRVLVMDVSDTKDNPQYLINPEILEKSGLVAGDEGCLSVPGVTEEVERAERVKVRSLDMEGNPVEFEAEGLFSVCIQHEMDHLDGKLFVDYLSELKRQRIKKKLTKTRRRDTDSGRQSSRIPLI
jgi:peptide deformylase